MERVFNMSVGLVSATMLPSCSNLNRSWDTSRRNGCHGLGSRFGLADLQDSEPRKRVRSLVRSLAARRHHRRREGGFERVQTKANDKEEVYRRSGGNVPEDRVVITFDMEEWKRKANDGLVGVKSAAQRSAGAVTRVGHEFVDESREAWRELCNSVRVQKDKRVVIAIKRSTVDFAGRVLLWSILGSILVKFLVDTFRRYRWGWEDNYQSRRSVRDRSLGGKEVLVSNGASAGRSARRWNVTSGRGSYNPLDAVETSRSEKFLNGQKDSMFSGRTKPARLPAWWPGASVPPAVTTATRQHAEEKANSFLEGITQKRLMGYDYTFEDMIELRQLCKMAGIKVKLDTRNSRDTFYRAAITHVLKACSSGVGGKFFIDLGGDDYVTFIAGLAENINLEEERAATMALNLLEKATEAEEELVRMIRTHAIFPPDNDSPEIELVGRGLDSQFSRQEKMELLESYVRLGGSKTSRVAEEALGLHLPG